MHWDIFWTVVLTVAALGFLYVLFLLGILILGSFLAAKEANKKPESARLLLLREASRRPSRRKTR